MNRLKPIVAMLLLIGAIPRAFATEPLHDQLTIDTEQGQIFPEKCCWIDLPESRQLQELRLADRCSALGGPVGQFKLEGDRIWLTGLYRCGGGIPLESVFPDLQRPVVAQWLSGAFIARVGHLCRVAAGVAVFRREIRLAVQQGAVQTLVEKVNDGAACAPGQPPSLRTPSASAAVSGG